MKLRKLFQNQLKIHDLQSRFFQSNCKFETLFKETVDATPKKQAPFKKKSTFGRPKHLSLNSKKKKKKKKKR